MFKVRVIATFQQRIFRSIVLDSSRKLHTSQLQDNETKTIMYILTMLL